MNLNTTRVCSLPKFPGYGLVVLTYLTDQRVLAACSGTYDFSDLYCYQLSPDQPSGWLPLGTQPPNIQCTYPSTTRNHLLQAGWFLIGQKDHCEGPGAAINTELLTPDLQWINLPISNPWIAGYPSYTCSVAINSTSVIVTGGINGAILSSTWMLDLSAFTWTQLQDMPGPRFMHGCTTTATGEVMIAGGREGQSETTSVYIYNLINNTWRRAGDLPNPRISNFYPVMLLWNKQPILLEALSSNIWIRDDGTSNWNKMEATMGADFKGAAMDLATAVPAELFTC